MKKIKQILKLFSFVIAILLMVSIFPSTKRNTAETHAASETFGYSVEILQKQELSLSTIGNHKMYDSTGSVGALDYWSYFNTRDWVPTANYSSNVNNSIGEISHNADSASSSSNADGHFYMVTNYATNIINAGKNGYASLKVRFYIKSAVSGSKDKADYVYATFSTGDSAGSLDYKTFAQESEIAETTDVSGGAFTDYKLVEFNVNNITTNSSMIHTYSEHQNNGLRITRNIMQIKQTEFIISTTDTTKPTITYEVEQGWLNKNKTLKLNVEDTQSGIYQIYINDTLISADYSEDTKTASYEMPVTENGTFNIKVVDNVGNTITKTYTETKIDKVKPSASIEIGETFTNKAVSFSSVIEPSTLSVDAFTVSYVATELFGQEMRNISGSQTFANGENTINFAENGKYTLTFTGVDEAGNAMPEVVVYIEVDDRTLVVLQIQEIYTYSASGFTPSYTASVDGDYTIKFTYETESGATASSINKIGTYTANYVIDAYAYKGSGSRSVTVSPKEVVISNFVPTYVYTGKEIEILFDKSEEVLLNISFYQAGTVDFVPENAVDFINAGSYVCVVEPVSENYFISNGNYDVVVNKQLLTVSNIKDSFIYDKQVKALDFDLSNRYQKSNIVISYYDADKNPIAAENVVNARNYYATLAFVGDTANYEFNSYSTLETAYSFNVDKREISVNVVSQNLTYGDSRADLAYTLVNVLETEPLVFTLSTNYDIYAGTYDITVDQKYNQTAAEAELLSNYDITYNEGKIVVAKKAITITPTQKQSKIYGDADTTLTYTVSGLVYGNTLSGELSREAGEDIGYYNITIGTIADANYEILLASERFEIVKRMAFIFIYNSNKVYGEADPEITFNENASNFTVADLEVLKTLNLFVRDAGENVGSYNIKVNDEAINAVSVFANYNILSIGSRLNIEKATVYASAEDKSVIYGDSAELTYVFTEKTIDDEIELELSREANENVGSYQIDCVNTSFENFNVVFTPATYTISQRQITITAKNSSKVYGENDNITYEVSNSVEELDVEMLREAGENAGEYVIYGFELNNSNYKVVEFKTAKFVIEKAPVTVTINDAEKTYGDIDPIFGYSVEGLVFDDKLDLSIVREAGENAGEYEISCEIADFENYTIESVVKGKLLVNKADYAYVLQDFTTIYSGAAVNLQVFDFEFELEYSFTDAVGTEVETPVNAGEYNVTAYFAGNENYNSFKTNTASLTIEKKVIPITLKKNVFLYNGKSQAPEYDINLETPVSVIIEYEGNADPIEIGDYGFKIISNNPNYICSYSSILKIVNEFYNEDESGASVSTSNVNFASSGIQISKNLNSNYMSMFNTIFDGRKCLAVYEFEGAKAVAEGEVFTVKVKAVGKKENVQIYTLDANGNLTPVSFAYSNGYYVLSINSLTADILITETNTILKYAKIVAVVTVLSLSFFVTKIINRRRKNSFFARNTSVRLLDRDFVKKNINIVYERVNYDKKVSVKSIIKKWG